MSIIKSTANFVLIVLLKIFKSVKVDFGASIHPSFFTYLWKRKLRDVNLRAAIIGNGVTIADGFGCFRDPEIFGKVDIGKYTTICGPATRVCASVNYVKIGAYCSIASNVVIQEYYHNTGLASTYGILSTIIKDSDSSVQKTSKGPIIIEDDVWIGSNAVILSGVTIGRGAVIGAGSVVTKDVLPYSVMGGNPAKKIKNRFSEDTIKQLEISEWWLWNKEKVMQEKDFFSRIRE